MTAYVLRFVNILKQRIKHNDTLQAPSVLCAMEISASETLWVRDAQLQLVKDLTLNVGSNLTPLVYGDVVGGFLMLMFHTQPSMPHCCLRITI